MKEGKTTTGNACLVHQDNNKIRTSICVDDDVVTRTAGENTEKVYKVMRLATITRKDVAVVFGDNFPCPPINNKRCR